MHFFVNNIFREIAAKENVKTASYGSVIIIGVGVTAGETFIFWFRDKHRYSVKNDNCQRLNLKVIFYSCGNLRQNKKIIFMTVKKYRPN